MEVERLIIVTVVFSTFFILILLLFIVGLIKSYKKNQVLQSQKFEMELKNKELEKTNAVIQAQEQERAKLSRNLHDEVGSVLAMANRTFKSTVLDMQEGDKHREDLMFMMDILDQSVDKIRSIAHGMVPHYLVKFGLSKTLMRLTEQTTKSLGHPCTFVSKIPENIELDQQAVIHFYSVILELLNNLLKHSHPQSIQLILEQSDEHLLLQIKHDGIAISQSDYEYLLNHSDGIGLESIAMRLKLISGELLYERYFPGGAINLAMPLTSKTSSDEKISI
jgi:signal transduction histidine kinase